MSEYWPEPGEELDPDKALEALRELHTSGGPPDFERAINLFMALDTHIRKGGELPVHWLGAEQCRQLVAQVNEEDEEADRMREALEFYADPDTYFAISFLTDPPCGAFADDFDEDHGAPEYTRRPMPGKKARKALKGEGDG